MDLNFISNNNNFHANKVNDMIQINYNLNFYNSSIMNYNFEQNYMNLMSNFKIIEYINNNLNNNKLLFQEIINYIQNNNFYPMNNDLFNIINNLNQFNNIIATDYFHYMNIMKQNVFYLIYLIQNNYIDQMNNNYMNQFNNFLLPIIGNLYQIYNNIINI